MRASNSRSCFGIVCSVLLGVVPVISGCTDAIGAADENRRPLRTIEQSAQESGQTWDPEGDFPVNPGPPYIKRPLWACSEVVAVGGAVPNAKVEVHDVTSGTSIGGGVANRSGVAEVTVPALSAGQPLYANQHVNGETSPDSLVRTVREFQGTAEDIPKPRIAEGVWECGTNVRSHGVEPTMKLEVMKDTASNVIGTEHPSKSPTSTYVGRKFPEGSLPSEVMVQQTYCPDTSNEVVGPRSERFSVQQAPDPIAPIDEVEVQAGTERVWVWGSYTGALGRFFENGTQKHAERLGYRNTFVDYWGNAVSDSADIAVQHQLCEGNRETVEAEVIPEEEISAKLSPPKIEEPICPSADVVEVKTTNQLGGKTTVVFPGGDHVTTGTSRNWTAVGVPSPGNLTSGSDVWARQVVRGTQSNHFSDWRSAAVSDDIRFDVIGAKWYTDQNTGQAIDGFVRETSRGPKFELYCCATCERNPETGYCSGMQQPRTATVGIWMDGTKVGEITLVENYPNHYTGRWDWFEVDGFTQTWPPPPNRDYTAYLLDSPCEVDPDREFDVLAGETDPKDQTSPELAELTVTGAGGESATVDSTSGDISTKVTPGETSTVSARGEDPEGMKSIEIVENPSGSLSRLKKSSDPSVVPIPPVLSFQTSLNALNPYQTVEMKLDATNYSDGSNSTPTKSTSVLTVQGRHETPQIQNLSPAEFYSNNEKVDIEGEHLAYPGSDLTAEVVFSMPNLGISEEVTQVNSLTVGSRSPTKLTDVDLPSAIEGRHGIVEVQVRTYKSGDTSTTKTSNTDTFRLLDRTRGSFKEYHYNDFTTDDTKVHDCSSPGTGAIEDVEIVDNPGGYATNALAVIDYGTSTVDVPFNHYAHDDEELGGVVVGDRCRTAVVHSFDETNSTTDKKAFIASIRHFPADPQVDYTAKDNVGADLQTLTVDGAYVWAKEQLSVFISPDGTIVSVGAPNPDLQNTGGNTKVQGTVVDMYYGVYNSTVSSRNQTTACSTCGFDSQFSGMNVELSVGGTAFVDLPLQ